MLKFWPVYGCIMYSIKIQFILRFDRITFNSIINVCNLNVKTGKISVHKEIFNISNKKKNLTLIFADNN